ncbi:cation transporter [Pseudooceanicola lipolyticus]|uniref:Cation transporter n=2 Tax=Pseudooceanicola TaxID=1679449 RepID=A0A2M8J1Q4_9RHOB|nr:cation diffusion facilitator family transporter [Pseudooceanicola lipolyticus]PJE36713.1 cation transporter [Pseudooceanicola lipolyticus]
MPHDHHHHHIDPDAGDARVAWAVVVNMVLTLAQVVGGLLSGSLALIADALHNFSDAISLIIAFFARKIARRPADESMSFGYGRAEVVAALVNYTTLVVLALYLIYEGILRMLEPQPINGWLVVWIAVIALMVDLLTAALTYSMSKHSMNIRAAFLHNLADALGSVAVILAGTCVILWGWTWVDPVVTLLIAGYILWHVKAEAGGVIRVLMLGSPPDMEMSEVIAAMRAVPGVKDLHHLHLWQMEEHRAALQAHVVIDESDNGRQQQIGARIKQTLRDRFGIGHTTLDIELNSATCTNTRLIGH